MPRICKMGKDGWLSSWMSTLNLYLELLAVEKCTYASDIYKVGCLHCTWIPELFMWLFMGHWAEKNVSECIRYAGDIHVLYDSFILENNVSCTRHLLKFVIICVCIWFNLFNCTKNLSVCFLSDGALQFYGMPLGTIYESRQCSNTACKSVCFVYLHLFGSYLLFFWDQSICCELDSN